MGSRCRTNICFFPIKSTWYEWLLSKFVNSTGLIIEMILYALRNISIERWIAKTRDHGFSVYRSHIHMPTKWYELQYIRVIKLNAIDKMPTFNCKPIASIPIYWLHTRIVRLLLFHVSKSVVEFDEQAKREKKGNDCDCTKL